jgi:hypothetical protein
LRKKRVSRLNASSLLFRLILPEGRIGALEARGELHSQAMETMK